MRKLTALSDVYPSSGIVNLIVHRDDYIVSAVKQSSFLKTLDKIYQGYMLTNEEIH